MNGKKTKKTTRTTRTKKAKKTTRKMQKTPLKKMEMVVRKSNQYPRRTKQKMNGDYAVAFKGLKLPDGHDNQHKGDWRLRVRGVGCLGTIIVRK